MEKLHEIEFKLLLNKETYHQIIQDYQKQISKSYTQINQYFTHPNISKNKLMLRIRQKENTYEFTLKEKDKIIGSHETNIMIDASIVKKLMHQEKVENEIVTILKGYNIEQTDIKPALCLSTYRCDIPLPLGMLSIDKNEYCQTTDFELEFEVTDSELGLEEFYKIIKKYDLTYTTNCPSKVVRALKKGGLL